MLAFAIHDVEAKLQAQKEVQDKGRGRILPFPARLTFGKAGRKAQAKLPDQKSQVEDLRKYEDDGEPDDYRRRMTINTVAFAFVVILGLAGIWLVEQMALLRKQQDCLFTGRKNCAEVSVGIVRD